MYCTASFGMYKNELAKRDILVKKIQYAVMKPLDTVEKDRANASALGLTAKNVPLDFAGLVAVFFKMFQRFVKIGSF